MELDGYGGTSFVHLECHKSLGNLWDSKTVSKFWKIMKFDIEFLSKKFSKISFFEVKNLANLFVII